MLLRRITLRAQIWAPCTLPCRRPAWSYRTTYRPVTAPRGRACAAKGLPCYPTRCRPSLPKWCRLWRPRTPTNRIARAVWVSSVNDARTKWPQSANVRRTRYACRTTKSTGRTNAISLGAWATVVWPVTRSPVGPRCSPTGTSRGYNWPPPRPRWSSLSWSYACWSYAG